MVEFEGATGEARVLELGAEFGGGFKEEGLRGVSMKMKCVVTSWTTYLTTFWEL